MIAVNGTEIPERAVAREVQNHAADSLEAARERAVRALVVRELLLQEARRLGIGPGDASRIDDGRPAETDDEATIRALIEREVRVPEADEATCRRYWENNRKRFTSPTLFEARHILIAARPDDEAAMTAAKAGAEAVLAELQAQPERFDALAAAHSDCPSGKAGGSLGQIGKGQTVPEFETFLFNLEQGQLCPVPARTRFGYHLIRLERRIEGRTLPFEQVHYRIASYLYTRAWQRAVAQYVKILAGRARIEGAEIEGAATPLVQ
jgi:peptidyl-prolyl cis-trans isomerase C